MNKPINTEKAKEIRKRFQVSEDFMTILELQQIMGKQVRKITDQTLTTEERETVNAESRFLIGFANQMINGGNLMLNAEKLLAENNDLDKSLVKDIIY